MKEHLTDLTNLINHQMGVLLSEFEAGFILTQSEKEGNIRLCDSKIAQLKTKDGASLAKILIEISPEKMA